MPVYVPRELFHAQGVLPVGIFGGGEDLEIIRGDAFYQSYICHIPRSTIELGLNGSYDVLDGMIFPAICDVIRNLSGMWTLQFPGKLSRYLDVPQNFDPPSAAASTGRSSKPWRSSWNRTVPCVTTTRISPRLDRRVQRKPSLVARVGRATAPASPWKVPTSELYVVLRAGWLMPVEEAQRIVPRLRRPRAGP